MNFNGDLKLYFAAADRSPSGHADIKITDADLLRDEGLQTSVLISLFSDARLPSGEKLGAYNDQRRGWWADDLVGAQVGSLLWTLNRSKITDGTLKKSEDYSTAALQWMVDDGLADDITATAAAGGRNQINIAVTITKTNQDKIFFRFYVNWENELTGGSLAA